MRMAYAHVRYDRVRQGLWRRGALSIMSDPSPSVLGPDVRYKRVGSARGRDFEHAVARMKQKIERSPLAVLPKAAGY